MNKIEIHQILHTKRGELVFPKASNPINNDNWKYPVEMMVKFGLAYDENNLYLKYKVIESNAKAITTEINGPVWEDSCVEFFIAFNDKGYYNLEFNCIGTQLCGYGTSNIDRSNLDQNIVANIKTKPSLETKPIDILNTPMEWTLDIVIPKQVFSNDDVTLEAGRTFDVNFYKCGDKQKEPHFLSWNAIDNPTPNFHLPAFFGKIRLV
ncbi:carbohydrate-binding family 9-like protein [Carboxylicivirga sp. N1Y90]|uniref:carbohydrate-binding family 9-like protein n=1 Tax=Carboxylicivirga fragile TaxID=3417571 RepID=UPI003D32AF06|nr:hypothetical protein [Marinilabiliaceae bacterium N1Y90]